MIVVSLSIRRYKGQIIPVQNSIDQQTDIFLVDDSGARGKLMYNGLIFSYFIQIEVTTLAYHLHRTTFCFTGC